MERVDLLEQVLDRYAAWYDVSRAAEEEAPLAATAQYHEHSTGFALIRKAEMWSADRHEFVFFFTLSELTAEKYDECFARALEMGEPLIKPDKDHMCSAITIVFFCDRVSEDARRKVTGCRYRKSFMFSLKGWMEVRACAVDLEESAVLANPVARDTKVFMDRVLHPRKRKRSFIQALLNRE